MRDFTTDQNFNITTNDAQAVFLFEHLENFANGKRFQVQEKNETGRWGGRGTDAQFTVYETRLTRNQIIAHYRNHMRG